MTHRYLAAARAAVLVSLALASERAAADPGYYLVSVYDNEGQVSLDFRYWTVLPTGRPAIIWPEIGIGYGVTKRWYTEFFASYIGSAGTTTQISSMNWQNDYLLTQGQFDFDVALHTNLIRNYGPFYDAYSFEFGPAIQTDIGRVQLNTNLIFEKFFDNAGAATPQLKYQFQAKYRVNEWFHFGVLGFGELGDWNQWAPAHRQSHRAGPVITGTVPLGTKQALRYDLAFLYGDTYARRGDMFSMRMQMLF